MYKFKQITLKKSVFEYTVTLKVGKLMCLISFIYSFIQTFGPSKSVNNEPWMVKQRRSSLGSKQRASIILRTFGKVTEKMGSLRKIVRNILKKNLTSAAAMVVVVR